MIEEFRECRIELARDVYHPRPLMNSHKSLKVEVSLKLSLIIFHSFKHLLKLRNVPVRGIKTLISF